jgi:GGDEF domain-containing protein
MLISLRKYLYGPLAAENRDESGPGFPQALLALSQNILKSLQNNAMLDTHSDLRQLKREIGKLEGRLAKAGSPLEIDSIGHEIAATLGAYRAKALELEQARATELNEMISSLNQTVAILSGSSHSSIGRLQRIEKDLERASAIEDIVALRSRLSECLQFVREETAREREDVARNLLLMQETVAKASHSVYAMRSDMPGRAEAECTLRDSPLNSSASFAVIFVLDRFQSIGSRFGPDAADAVMDFFIGALKSKITEPKRFFRWNTASILLLLLDRTRSKGEALEEIQSVNWAALEKKVEAGDRMAVLSLSNQWVVFSLLEEQNRDELIAKIDQFANPERRGVAEP